MERITISLESGLAESFDELVAGLGYASRSEAVRDLIRDWISRHALRREAARHCVAQIGYIYNHHDRSLAERLARIQHSEHHLAISTMHMHLNHEERCEVIFVRGPTADVRRFADRLIAEKGVRHGNVLLVPVEIERGPRGHHGPEGTAGTSHVHIKPIS